MRRWLVVLVVAACGTRGSDAPPPPPVPVTNDAPAPPIPAPPPFDIAPPADKLVAVGRGDRHACVVHASGAVDCWGQHRAPCKDCWRTLGPDPTIRRVAGIDDAVGVSANARCFLRRGGEVACLAADSLTAEPLAGIHDARIGDPSLRCFIDSKGGVTCIDNDEKPWKVPNVTDAVAISSSEYSTCIVRKSGTVACGSIHEHTPFRTLQGIDQVTEIAMVGTFEHLACAVTRGRVRCFGISTFPEPNEPFKAEFLHDGQPMDLPHPDAFIGATQIAMWKVDREGSVILEAVVGGKIVQTNLRDPTVIPVLVDATIHTRECAIRAQGSLACWGTNSGGVLAQPTTLSSFDVPPTTVVGLSGVVDIATGLMKSFALTSDGRVWWWGHTDYAYGVPVPSVLPLGLGPDKLVQIVATTKDHVCMRSSTGDVWCQTASDGNRIEQLDTDGVLDMAPYDVSLLAYRGDGTIEKHTIAMWQYPVAPMTIEPFAAPDVVQYAPIGSSRCERRRNGTVRCPTELAGLTAATAVVAGGEHACAVQRGRVWCWFSGSYDRDTTPASEVPGLRDVTDLASSSDHVCAVHGGGHVSCWHYTSEARKDQKPKRTWSPPHQIIAGGALDVELGLASSDQYERSFSLHGPSPAGQYGCARMVDRTVRCWGSNLYGELGDGSYVAAKSPIGVTL
jgi:alpha-tubulin suppressor-like RCC1 family protein